MKAQFFRDGYMMRVSPVEQKSPHYYEGDTLSHLNVINGELPESTFRTHTPLGTHNFTTIQSKPVGPITGGLLWEAELTKQEMKTFPRHVAYLARQIPGFHLESFGSSGLELTMPTSQFSMADSGDRTYITIKTNTGIGNGRVCPIYNSMLEVLFICALKKAYNDAFKFVNSDSQSLGFVVGDTLLGIKLSSTDLNVRDKLLLNPRRVSPDYLSLT